jgi:hypothetical protein
MVYTTHMVLKDIIALHNSAIEAEISPQIDIIKDYHLRKWGEKMKDSAYHCFIERSGKTIWHPEGLDAILYHAGHYNQRAVGICVAGLVSQDGLTKEQLDSLVKAVDLVRHWKNISLIYNHKELRKTLCPGVDLRSLYEKEKERRQVPVNTESFVRAQLRAIERGIKRSTGRTRDMLKRKRCRLLHRIEARYHDDRDCCPKP